jgi:hypothetical protein
MVQGHRSTRGRSAATQAKLLWVTYHKPDGHKYKRSFTSSEARDKFIDKVKRTKGWSLG